MKKNFHIIIFAALIITILQCCSSSPGGGSSSSASSSLSSSSSSAGSGTQFWAVDFTSGYYYPLYASLLYTGSSCLVYGGNSDISSGAVTSAEAAGVGRDFDTNIYSLDTNVFGAAPDVDNNGKVIILIFTFNEDLSGGSFVAGYFDPYQEMTGTDSTGQDIVFLNCDLYLQQGYGLCIPASESFDQTIAHEFQHMINFRVRDMNGLNEEDTWINEGLSVSAEGLYEARYYGGFNYTDDRVSFYNNSSENINIAAGMNFVYWVDYYENYVTDFLFFQWLRIQSGGSATKDTGIGIYKDIITNSLSDYTAVVAAVNKDTTLSSASWQTILCSWFAANWIHSPTGLYGYNGLISTTPGTLNSLTNISNQTWPIYPGWGVYINNITAGYIMNASGTIAYAGLTNNNLPDTNASITNETVLLCYNWEGSPGAGYTGKLPDIVTSITRFQPGSAAASGSMAKGPHPVDRVFRRDQSIAAQVSEARARKAEMGRLINKTLFGRE